MSVREPVTPAAAVPGGEGGGASRLRAVLAAGLAEGKPCCTMDKNKAVGYGYKYYSYDSSSLEERAQKRIAMLKRRQASGTITQMEEEELRRMIETYGEDELRSYVGDV
tara:strand:- start:313 stop:639 length:327 start_codon:yes stop_codon:yes gene_type:complete